MTTPSIDSPAMWVSSLRKTSSPKSMKGDLYVSGREIVVGSMVFFIVSWKLRQVGLELHELILYQVVVERTKKNYALH